MVCTLIEHGYLIPMDRERVIEDGAIVLDGPRVAYVGKAGDPELRNFTPDKIVDARGKAILPGLVNTHTHLVGAYIKAMTEDVPGKGNAAGLYKRAIPIATSVGTDDLYWGALTHAMEMLMTGTTTISNTWTNEKFTAPAVRDLGIRAVISEAIFETDLTKLHATQMERPWDKATLERGLDATIELYEAWEGKADGRITTRVGPGGPGYVSQDGLERCRDLAAKLGVGLNIHIAEVPGETEFVLQTYGRRPMKFADDIGLLGPRTIGFHCVFLDDSDIDIFARTRTNLSHTSFHVPKRGYFPPMEKVYAKDCEVSLGSDWCSNDLWKFMRAAILIPRAKTGDVGLTSGYDALRMATVGGARGLGLEDRIGTLEVGKRADVIMVDVLTPWCSPIRTENLITNLVFNANGSDVTDVYVDGKAVVEDGELKTMNKYAVLKETQQRADRIWEEASKSWQAI